MFKKHINHKKIIACALGVILGFAPAPALISAVTVHAEENTGNWVTSLGVAIDSLSDDLSAYVQDNGIVQPTALYALASAVSLQNTYYQNLKWAIDKDVEMFVNPSVYVGYYRTSENSDIYSGVITAPRSFDYATISSSVHWSIEINWEPYSPSITGTPNCTSYLDNNGFRYSCSTSSGEAYTFTWSDNSSYLSGVGRTTVLANTTKVLFTALTTTDPPVVNGTISGSSKTLLGSGAIPELPDLGVPMEKANPQPYFDALQNYIRDTFPDTPAQLIPSVSNDEYVSLPTSPHIGLNAEKGHLNDLNLDLEPYSSGFDFWWWLTDSVLTDLHLRTVVLLLIALGSVGFIVWKVGR